MPCGANWVFCGSLPNMGHCHPYLRHPVAETGELHDACLQVIYDFPLNFYFSVFLVMEKKTTLDCSSARKPDSQSARVSK